VSTGKAIEHGGRPRMEDRESRIENGQWSHAILDLLSSILGAKMTLDWRKA